MATSRSHLLSADRNQHLCLLGIITYCYMFSYVFTNLYVYDLNKIYDWVLAAEKAEARTCMRSATRGSFFCLDRQDCMRWWEKVAVYRTFRRLLTLFIVALCTRHRRNKTCFWKEGRRLKFCHGYIREYDFLWRTTVFPLLECLYIDKLLLWCAGW